MISPRWIAQFGLVAAAGVFAVSVGILMVHNGDAPQTSGPVTVAPVSHDTPTISMPLSATADSRVARVDQH